MVNEERMLHPYYSIVFAETVRELMENPPETFGHSGSWDTILFPEDGSYEKPPKELFEERFKQNFRNEGFRILREKRNKLLNESDWTDQHDIEEWVAYRQALRDLPATTEDPEQITWPEPPQVKIVPGKNTTRTQLETELTETKSALDEERTLHETTRADLEEKTYQIISLEARLQALEQKILAAN